MSLELFKAQWMSAKFRNHASDTDLDKMFCLDKCPATSF